MATGVRSQDALGSLCHSMRSGAQLQNGAAGAPHMQANVCILMRNTARPAGRLVYALKFYIAIRVLPQVPPCFENEWHGPTGEGA